MPGLIWLGGFMSDMQSTKASFLDQFAENEGRAFLRFDYSGHGQSDGRFEEGTIGCWFAEALAVIRAASEGPQILVGSSIGGWIALLCARALVEAGETSRLHGLILIAPAVDFTERLIFERLSVEARRQIETEGVWLRPSPYSANPYPITKALIEEGRQHLLFGDTIRSHCPVHILQGMLRRGRAVAADHDSRRTSCRRSRRTQPHQRRRPSSVTLGGSHALAANHRDDDATRGTVEHRDDQLCRLNSMTAPNSLCAPGGGGGKGAARPTTAWLSASSAGSPLD